MILKSLTLENFRSYGPSTKIDFEHGITLFEGDIGSGKSSILYAIEFALFGLGDIEARYALRSSAASSKVELDFEVEGQEYKVVRTIERKKGAKTLVTNGWLSERGGKLESYAATELRSKILKILNFKEKTSAKSSSRIFRFAVFTPQELMREVLSQKPDERIDTLRRAFGIEDYSVASNNAEVVSRSLKTRAELNSSLARALPEKEASLDKLGKQLAEDTTKLERANKELAIVEENIKQKESDLRELEAARDSAKALESLIPELERSLSESKLQFSTCKLRLDALKKELAEIQKARTILSALSEDYTLYAQSKERLRSLEHLRDEQQRLDSKISELRTSIASKESALTAELASKKSESEKYASYISQLENEVADLDNLREQYSSLEEKIKEEEGPLGEQLDKCKSEISALRALINEKRSAISKIKSEQDLNGMSRCPLCGQELDPTHLQNVAKERKEHLETLSKEIEVSNASIVENQFRLKELDSRVVTLDKEKKSREGFGRKIATLEKSAQLLELKRSELAQLGSRISQIESELQNKEYSKGQSVELNSLLKKRDELAEPLKEISDLKSRLSKMDSLQVEKRYLASQEKAAREPKMQSQLKEEENTLSSLELSIEEKSKEISAKRVELESLEPMIFHYSKTKEALFELQGQRDTLRSTVDKLNSAVSINSKNHEDLKKEVLTLREKETLAAKHRSTSSWLESSFLPTISEIETYVLDSINEEFERTFEHWFSILIEEGDIEVKLDERFTPLVTQSGYELDVQSLSGGERTALALAYRLALNFMVRKASETAQSSNLLILDEPTEGFSKEQVYRLRNVLEELESEQIILVSHERDLEAVADRVFRVEKFQGDSRILDLAK